MAEMQLQLSVNPRRKNSWTLAVLLVCFFLAFVPAQPFTGGLKKVPKMVFKRRGPRRAPAMSADIEVSDEKGQILGPYWRKKKILNPASAGGGAASEGDGGGAVDLAQELRASINLLFLDFVDYENNTVDYEGLRNSEQFKRYLAAARRLAGPAGLAPPPAAAAAARKAFYLNVYNALAVHSQIALGEPRGLPARLQIYATASYRVGPHILSMNDIENGILRGNRPGATPLARAQFREGDPRRALALAELDPRVHFALNCGAVSCPPIQFYSEENLEEELEVSSRNYMKQVKVDSSSTAVQLPKLLEYYSKDFGNNKNEVLQWVARYVSEDQAEQIRAWIDQGENIKISYGGYNWDSNKK